jgi:hypothetical protein
MHTDPPIENFPLVAPPFQGNSRAVAAGNAFDWLRQGWALFAVSPGGWIAITIVLLVLMLGLNIVPLVGALAANLLTPLLAAGLLESCQKAADGLAPEVGDLFAGFKHNTGNLVTVGVFYMTAMLVVLLIVLALGGGSVAGGLMMGRPAGIGLAFGGLLLAMLLSLALTVPLVMALWFAPALVYFNNMMPLPALKAISMPALKTLWRSWSTA